MFSFCLVTLVFQLVLGANVIDAATSAGLTTLLDLVVKANLVEPLTDGKNALTILAPTNAAFASIPNQIIETLLQRYNQDLLVEILKYHVFAQKYDSSIIESLINSTTPPTLQGSKILVSEVNNILTLNGNSKVIVKDVSFENGVNPSVVHVIDSVLIPPIEFPFQTIVEKVISLQSQGQFTILLQIIKEFGNEFTSLLSSFTPKGFTVFAPVDSAWKNLPKRFTTFPLSSFAKKELRQILQLHVAKSFITSKILIENAGKRQKYDTYSFQDLSVTLIKDDIFVLFSKVVAADVRCSNGIIHAVDRILVPWWLSYVYLYG